MKNYLLIIHYLLVAILLLINFPLHSQNSNKILLKDSKLIKLFDGGFFTEGPAYGIDGNIYFSDLTFTNETNMQAGIIWRHDLKTGETNVYRSPSGMANGIAFDENGNMIVCEGADYGGRKITSTDLKTGKSKILTALFNDLPYNSPNDLVIDSRKRIYFTDPRYSGYEKVDQPHFGVYRIDPAGYVELIEKEIEMPNGIAISQDESKLYIACNFEGSPDKNSLYAVYSFDLDETGKLSNKKILLKYEGFGPDGLTVDNSGNLYVALRDESNPGIYIYDKNANQLEIIKLPETPSNVTFGKGKYKNNLFITAGKSLYTIKINAEGKK